MKIIFLLAFAYFSYYFVVKYPLSLSKIFGAKDARLEKVLNKIWYLNFSERAFVIHKMMKRPQNKEYISLNYPNLLKGYERSRKYWLISLIPVAILIVYGQISMGYEIVTDREGFSEKIENSWYNRWFHEYFGSGK